MVWLSLFLLACLNTRERVVKSFLKPKSGNQLEVDYDDDGPPHRWKAELVIIGWNQFWCGSTYTVVKLKKRDGNTKKCYLFFELTSDNLSINAFYINLSDSPKNQPLKFSWRNIVNWRSWKMTFFVLFFVFLNRNHTGFHMR